MNLQKYLETFTSVCWYPSSGFDFREMMYLTSEYAQLINWSEPVFPDCFVLTDYFVFQYSDLLNKVLQGETIIFCDEGTKIVAKRGTELTRLDIPFHKALVAFKQDENYGRVIVSDIEIQSSVLGNLKTKLVYVVAENTSFAIEFLVKNKLNIDYVLHVRYGHALGGGRSNGMFVKRILKDINTRYFLSDMNYKSEEDYEAFDVYGELLKSKTDAVLQEITYIPSYRWSRSGDVHIYKIA